MDTTQAAFLESDECILVDESDKIVGHMNKEKCHRGVGVLHRAFSVLAFSRSTNRMLLQRRAASKITFPLLWSNTCCSHPLHPHEVDLPHGIRRAAVRKLEHELGIKIPQADTSITEFVDLCVIRYAAKYDEVWGESEVDHVLGLVVGREEDLGVVPNENEVGEVKWVSEEEMREMLRGGGVTPWFRLICERMLFGWWEQLRTKGTLKHLDGKDLQIRSL